MALTRFVAVYLAVAALAVGAALITLLIAPRQIAPVAAATVMLSAISLALGIRQAVIDRGALHVDITLERYGISDDLVIQARVYNDGRRPVRIEELGFAAGKSRTIRYPSWTAWGRGNDDPVPMTLGESESQRLWTWPHLVARWYVNFEPSTWMFVTHVDGRPRWRKLRRTYAPHWQPGGLGSGRPTARSRRRRPRSLARSTPGATHPEPGRCGVGRRCDAPTPPPLEQRAARAAGRVAPNPSVGWSGTQCPIGRSDLGPYPPDASH